MICLRYVGGRLREAPGWDPDRAAVVYERSTAGATDGVVYKPHRLRWGAPNPRELVLFLAGGVEPDHEHLADIERWIQGRRP